MKKNWDQIAGKKKKDWGGFELEPRLNDSQIKKRTFNRFRFKLLKLQMKKNILIPILFFNDKEGRMANILDKVQYLWYKSGQTRIQE